MAKSKPSPHCATLVGFIARSVWLGLAFSFSFPNQAQAGPDESGTQTPRSIDEDDADADGVSDEVERGLQTDPHVPGLFPGSYPHVPEPLSFDLVRGLGAERGEFEFNVLAASSFAPYDGLRWAPEVEWAFADRHAIEFELPMHDASLEAMKLAVQGTFRERRPKFIHGWQFIGEGRLRGAGEFSALYIAGRRIGRRTSVLAMLGPRLHAEPRRLIGELVINPSIFVDLGERATVGLENNAVLAGRLSTVRTLPQFHLQLGQHFRVQFGAGIETARDGVRPSVAVRLIVE